MSLYLHGTDILGGVVDVVGTIDIGAARLKMDDLKVVSTRIARALLKGGQSAIDGAMKAAKQPWYKSDLPGDKARDEVFWKLKWHSDTLAKAPLDPNAIYTAGDDLKHWVMQAFIEANAAEEGAAWLAQAWSDMWTEIGEALKSLPKTVAKFAGNLASSVVENATGVPIWGWVVGGLALTGVVGYGLYRLFNSAANSKAGAVVAGVAARRYLP